MKLYLKSFVVLTFSFICSNNLFAQTNKHPLLEIINSKMDIQKRVQKIDNLVATTENNVTKNDSTPSSQETPSNKTVIKTVYDGSKNLNETRTLKYAGEEKVVQIGAGNFKNILYVDKLTNQVIKVKHINTMEYMYEVGEDEKANTERLEVSIYYANEKPFYAIFKEDHYKNANELLFSNTYQLQMTTFHKDVYFDNDFQKTIYKYIQETSDAILKQK